MKEGEIQSATAITTAEYNVLKKKADILDFLFGEKGVRTENLMKLQIWREKAERWDQYAIYDNDNEPEILVKDLIVAYEKLEAVKTWMEEEWSNMNAFYQLDITTHEHPRWKLKEILEAKAQ